MAILEISENEERILRIIIENEFANEKSPFYRGKYVSKRLFDENIERILLFAC